MKRLTAMSLAVVLAMGTLSACGSSETAANTETPAADTAATETASEDSSSEEDIDLGSLDALESFSSHEGDILLEDQTGLDILTEDDLPSPAELDSAKDFSENN